MKRKHKKHIEPQVSWSAEKIRWYIRSEFGTMLLYSKVCVCGHLSVSHDLYVRHELPANIQGKKCLKKNCICPKLCGNNLEYLEALYEAKSDNTAK